MSNSKPDRPSFREWVDECQDPGWQLLPLTHITKGIGLEDISRSEKIRSKYCDVLREDVCFFFYGRPAYRTSGDGVVKVEAACPTCLIFKPELINDAHNIHAFDTGAFGKRLYSHIILEEMHLGDFSLEKDACRPNKLIKKVFQTAVSYIEGDVSAAIHSTDGAESWEFHARAYLDLIHSPGRNEPDDRIFSIEIAFKGDVDLKGKLIGIVVPHTLWSETKKTPWLQKFFDAKVKILPFKFVPNKGVEYYNALIESIVQDFYRSMGLIDG